MPHYTFEHSEFVDEDGLACEAVRFELEDENLLDLPWMQGIAFAELPPVPLVLRMNPLGNSEPVVFDYLGSPVPLISARMKMAWDAAGVTNVEYFQTRIDSSAGLDEPVEYFAFNVVGRVSAADPDASQSTQAFGRHGADMFTRFVPRQDINAAPRLFRMSEHLSTIIVDEQVMRTCLSADVDTLDFKPLAEWLR